MSTSSLLLCGVGGATAVANTHSLDLEASSTQYASIADASQTGLDLSGNFTIECWVKRESTGAAMSLVSKYNTTSNLRAYTFQIRSDNKLQIGVSDDGTNSAGHLRSYQSTSTITSTADYVHLAASFDISTETCLFYINGTEEAAGSSTGTGIGASLFNSSAAFIVGAEENGAGIYQYFDGLIDEVRVWSVVRTQTEINNNKSVQLTGSESNLVAYYRFNNDYLDQTANNNDLTSSGSPVFSTTVPF